MVLFVGPSSTSLWTPSQQCQTLASLKRSVPCKMHIFAVFFIAWCGIYTAAFRDDSGQVKSLGERCKLVVEPSGNAPCHSLYSCSRSVGQQRPSLSLQLSSYCRPFASYFLISPRRLQRGSRLQRRVRPHPRRRGKAAEVRGGRAPNAGSFNLCHFSCALLSQRSIITDMMLQCETA